MDIVSVFQGLLAPIIAIIVAYVAWQQWKLSHDRFALDLYDRRISAYREVKKLLGKIMRNAKIDNSDLLEFFGAVSESEFLFGNDIREYNDLLYKNGLKLSYLNGLYSRGIKGEVKDYDNEKTVEEEHELLGWFIDQYQPAKDLYGQYLKIDRKK